MRGQKGHPWLLCFEFDQIGAGEQEWRLFAFAVSWNYTWNTTGNASVVVSVAKGKATQLERLFRHVCVAYFFSLVVTGTKFNINQPWASFANIIRVRWFTLARSFGLGSLA